MGLAIVFKDGEAQFSYGFAGWVIAMRDGLVAGRR
jgi:hypothetical protein